MPTFDPRAVVRNAGLENIFAPQIIDENNNMSAGYTPTFNEQGYLIDPRAGGPTSGAPAGTPYVKKGPNGNAFTLDQSGQWVDTGQKFNDVEAKFGPMAALKGDLGKFIALSAGSYGLASGLGGVADWAASSFGLPSTGASGLAGGMAEAQLPLDAGIDFGSVSGLSTTAGAAGSLFGALKKLIPNEPKDWASLLTGIYGLTQKNKLENQTEELMRKADPFGPERAGYAQRLATLWKDPTNEVTKLPGYQAGLEAVRASGAGQGWTGGGNMMTSLAKYGGDFFNTASDRLAKLAGADIGPGTAAQVGLQGFEGSAEIGSRAVQSILLNQLLNPTPKGPE